MKYERVKHVRLMVAVVLIISGLAAFLTFVHAAVVGARAHVLYALDVCELTPWAIISAVMYLIGVIMLITINYHYYQYDEPEETEQQEEKEKQAE